jgi:L-ascorbate metabolism protein UlaG (beta-lactamase superfamily)
MQPQQLPALDAVVLSHLHGDHFDRVARRGLDRRVPVFSTPQAARRLGQWGFDAHGMHTWERRELSRGDERLQVESVPAVHARGLMGRLLPRVMGSVITHTAVGGEQRRVYVTGDTLTGDHLDRIRERHPNLDTAVVHLGGTRVLMHTVTMDAAQGLDFLRRVQPPRAVAVHHDDYGVFRSPVERFVRGAAKFVPGVRVEVPERGDTIAL